MSEKKHIDKLFKEQFKDFEETPSDAVWTNIEKELNKDKRKRRVIPIWWKVAGVAAVLALMLTVGNAVFFKSSNNGLQNTNGIVDNDKDNKFKESSAPDSDPEVNLPEAKTPKKASNLPEVIVENEMNSKESEKINSVNQNKAEELVSENNNGSNNDAIVNSDINNKDNLNNPQNYKESSKEPINKVNTESVVVNNSKQLNEQKNKTNQTLNRIDNAVAINNNLSNKNSKSNKSSENTLIDSSNADALISNSKRDTSTAVTDNKTAVQNESQTEMESTQTAPRD